MLSRLTGRTIARASGGFGNSSNEVGGRGAGKVARLWKQLAHVLVANIVLERAQAISLHLWLIKQQRAQLSTRGAR